MYYNLVYVHLQTLQEELSSAQKSKAETEATMQVSSRYFWTNFENGELNETLSWFVTQAEIVALVALNNKQNAEHQVCYKYSTIGQSRVILIVFRQGEKVAMRQRVIELEQRLDTRFVTTLLEIPFFYLTIFSFLPA